MSDEPLYCEKCGKEWGQGPDDCRCDYDMGTSTAPPRHARYCHVCGVIPAEGQACHFYESGGNAVGCRAP